jgi:hypothetical protein
MTSLKKDEMTRLSPTAAAVSELQMAGSVSARVPDRRRWPLYVAAVIGVALIVMPLVFNMFDRAPKGATMLEEFRPFMTTARLDGFQADIRQVSAAVAETNGPVSQRLRSSAGSGAGSSSFPSSYTSLSSQWPVIDATMTNLLDKVQGNLGNYRAVAALPSFTLFPWFFVLPGVITLGLAGAGLLWPRRRGRVRVALVVLGVGLILAPAVFQMWQRAPEGGRMMSTFRTIETTSNVERIQGYFSTMASGQGAIRLDIVPALERSGLTTAEIESQFPAVATLDSNWVHILNDMTPMIGAMSDGVPDYQAISSLPAFPLFPWFFVLPGVVLGGLALLIRPQGAS